MLKSTCHIGAAALLLAAFVLYPKFTSAQISPTNSATLSGSVSDSAGKPVADAKVSLQGPKNVSTQTDSHGDFAFISVPFGSYELSASAENLGTAMRSISVQGDTNVAIQYEPTSINGLKTIASVTARAAQFNVTPASITQVNPTQAALNGVTTWRKILEQIPGISIGGEGSGGSTLINGVPDSPFTPMLVSINGAPPYETAILLDDMPLIGGTLTGTPGGGTDLSSYALNGVSTADIVRGPGANAPSIVGSIGGSLNMHSPGVVTQNQFDFSASTDPYGGIVTQFLGAMHWSKLSAVLAYGVNDSPGPIAQYGFPGGVDAIPATVDGHFFGAVYPSLITAPNSSPSSFNYYGFTNTFQMCCFDNTTAWSQHSGSLALAYAFTPRLSAEFYFSGQKNLGNSPTTLWTSNFIAPPGYTGALNGTNYFPYGTDEGAPNANDASTSVREEKITAQIGRGVLKVAALQNTSFNTVGYVTPSGGTYQLYGQGYYCAAAGPYCGYGFGPPISSSPVFNGGTYNVTFNPSFEVQSVSTYNRDELLSYATPIGDQMRAGVSYIQSYYDWESTELTPTSSCQSPAGQSQNTQELRAFIGGDPTEKTSLDLSTYFVRSTYHVPNFSGTGFSDLASSYFAPRLGFVWHPQTSVAIRVAAGGGFSQAPLESILPFSDAGVPYYEGTQYFAQLSNPNLQPEKSFAIDLGTDIRLHHNTTLSFDVYRANLFGQLYYDKSIQGTYTGVGGTLPLCVAQYENLGQSRYEGLLVDIRHDVPRGTYWSFGGGLTRGYLVSVAPSFYNLPGETCNFTTTVGCANLNIVPGINFNGTNEVGANTSGSTSIPYAQGLATVGYRWNPEKYLDLTGTYYGNNNSYMRPAFVEVDGHASYPLNKHVSLLMTFRNITGIYDSPIQIQSLDNINYVPVVAGLPYVENGETVGPRTAILTANFQL